MTPCPFFLPDATTTSHPLTPQLTDAVYAGSQLPSLNPAPDPATAPAGDTSSQTPRWLAQTVAASAVSTPSSPTFCAMRLVPLAYSLAV